MKHPIKFILAGAAFCAASQTAFAGEMSSCELMLVQTVEIEAEGREAQIASYHSADNFVLSVKDDILGHITQVGGVDIHGVLCERNEVIPTKSDYAVLATGIPLVLSQNFDMQDTDSLTVKWIEGQFKYAYKGYPLSDEAETTLKARLAAFSKQGLNDWAIKAAEAKEDAAAQAELEMEDETAEEPEALETLDPEDGDVSVEIETDDATEPETLQPNEMDATEIVSPDNDTTEATKLHIQTKIEIEE